jgi:hypothetical protein
MQITKILHKLCLILGAIVLLAGLSTAARAGSDVELSAGQIVYVPIYSHIYSGLKGRPFSLAAIPTASSSKNIWTSRLN